jgi:hypothetical protein
MDYTQQYWRSRKRGPKRLIVGETLACGELFEVLECGHKQLGKFDEDGMWDAKYRCCKECLCELASGRRQTEFLSKAEQIKPTWL